MGATIVLKPKSTWRRILFMNDQAEVKPEPKKKKKRATLITLIVIVILVALVFLYWFIWARFSLSTNDAYVQGHTVEVYSQVNGNVSSLKVQDTAYVKEGDLLVELDPTDYLIEFENSKSNLANTIREVIQMFDNVYQLKAYVEQQQSQLDQAQFQFLNREALAPIGAVTGEDFLNSETNLAVAQASLNQALEDLRGSEAQIYNTTVETHPKVEEAKDKVRIAWLNLQRTFIKAPVSGYIANSNIQVGESVNTQTPLLSVVPLEGLWANANFKEVKLKNVRIGQPVELTSSMYGSKVKFKGVVLGISPGTGSIFSVLPPQNATGNWIKIVQRVPVRVSLDAKQLKEYPLRLGLSLDAKIDLRNQGGEPIHRAQQNPPVLETSVFKDQICGVDAIIHQVLQDNINMDLNP